MDSEDDAVHRMAATSLAAETGMSFEHALDAISFQDAAGEVLDQIDEALGEASGDQWFDWSDGRGRLKIGVTTRADPSAQQRVERILKSANLRERADLVPVVWSINELQAAQERAWEQLERLTGVPVGSGLDPSANAVELNVPQDLTVEQLRVVEAAVRAAAVSVQVKPDASWIHPASA